MKKWKVTMAYDFADIYYVYADTEDEAIKKALSGEVTPNEFYKKCTTIEAEEV